MRYTHSPGNRPREIGQLRSLYLGKGGSLTGGSTSLRLHLGELVGECHERATVAMCLNFVRGLVLPVLVEAAGVGLKVPLTCWDIPRTS